MPPHHSTWDTLATEILTEPAKTDENLALLASALPKSSTRLQRLKAQHLQNIGKKTEAIEILEGMEDTESRKLYLSMIEDPIPHYIEYINTYATDLQAWQELSELYIKEQMFAQALHCTEECLMIQPWNWTYYTRIAEIYYALGGIDNYALASKYWCKSLEVSEQRITLLGLHQCYTMMEKVRELEPDVKELWAVIQSKLNQNANIKPSE